MKGIWKPSELLVKRREEERKSLCTASETVLQPIYWSQEQSCGIFRNYWGRVQRPQKYILIREIRISGG
jgi:hypothetical protein